MSLVPTETVQKLQGVLQAKAKSAPTYRFCAKWLGELAEELREKTYRPQPVRREAGRELPEETFDFLGYTIGRCYSKQTGRAYLGTKPAAKKVRRICDAISEHTGRHTTLLSAEKLVAHLNRMLVGWANYFCLGPVSQAYRAIDQHVCRRLRQWLCAKHKVQGQGTTRFPDEYLYQVLQLARLGPRTKTFSWAKA